MKIKCLDTVSGMSKSGNPYTRGAFRGINKAGNPYLFLATCPVDYKPGDTLTNFFSDMGSTPISSIERPPCRVPARGPSFMAKSD